jgi:hypothetical protein
LRVGNWNKFWLRCRCHSRRLYNLFLSGSEMLPVIPIPDLFLGGSAPRLQSFSLDGIPYPGFCLIFFCLLLTLLALTSPLFPIPDTFHPKRSSLPSPCCPASNILYLNSNPLNLALTGKPDVRLHQNVLSSPLSFIFISKVLSNI